MKRIYAKVSRPIVIVELAFGTIMLLLPLILESMVLMGVDSGKWNTFGKRFILYGLGVLCSLQVLRGAIRTYQNKDTCS